jgi:hypothetical protein
MNDKIVTSLADFLRTESCGVIELDLSKNQITDLGLKSLSFGLTGN